MHKLLSALFFTFWCPFITLSQPGLDYYLPTGTTYNPEIPTPQSILGHQVGEWHVSHDKLLSYMKALSESSDRIILEEHARSHEGRPLISLKISSHKNIKNLEELRKKHLQLSDQAKSNGINPADVPLVVYLGYSIHGDEPSGSNASMLVAYYLAAAQGNDIDSWLENTIIILDPSYNPDGLNRYASWVNSRKSLNLVADPNSTEHNEPWPTGRSNHYWFDLNRDWLPLVHPESQGRVAHFHRWKPNVLTDHHEMGPSSTFFFQPGIPSRNNPLTPEKTFELTEKIAGYHAKNLDMLGSLYYSKESFDDFYVGKGSTYPDINGAVGILFEQAGAEGHLQLTANGELSFPFAIKNHLTTSLSTLRAAVEMKSELLHHQKQFYADIPALVDKSATKGYVFEVKNDFSKLNAFLSVLDTHQIDVYKLAKHVSGFDPESSYIIPLRQNQMRMIQALFETRTQFQDSLFYDVSAWTLPLAFDIRYHALGSKTYSSSLLGNMLGASEVEVQVEAFDPGEYAYAFDWQDSQAPSLLYDIQKLGLRTRMATEAWSSNDQQFERGSIVIPCQGQNFNNSELHNYMVSLSKKHKINISAIRSGATSNFQLGSPKFRVLKQPRPLLIMGKGTNSYEAGEIWHLMDQRIGMALPMTTQSRVNTMDLSDYNIIILTSGNFGTLNQQKIKTWIQQGGTIIALKNAGKWCHESGFSKIEMVKVSKDSTQKFLTYGDRSKMQGAQRIGGAIFETQIDLTHPLFYGFPDDQLPVFKRGLQVMELAANPYAQPARYTDTPLMAGYISEENLEKIPNTPAVGLSVYGKGLTIVLNDNPNFRGYWYGTNRLFLNAIFFGNTIDKESAR